MNPAEIDELPLLNQKPVGRQGAFHKSQSLGRWCIAGNRSGKTHAGAREAAFWLTGLHPYRDLQGPVVGWVVTLDREFALEVLQPKVLQFIPESLIEKVGRGAQPKIELVDGSKLIFRSYGQGWAAFQGAALHFAWFDEEPPEPVFDEVCVRLVDHKGSYWVTMTPLQGKTWVHKRIVSQSKVVPASEQEIFSWATTDNTTLDRAFVERTFGRLDPKVRNARMNGDFFDLEGLVYTQWSDSHHVVDPVPVQRHWPVTVGLDYGYSHPFGMVFIATAEDGTQHVFRALKRAGLSVSQVAEVILETLLRHTPWLVDTSRARYVLEQIHERRLPKEERPIIRARFYVDPSAPDVIDELNKFGIPARAGQNGMDAGINRVAELMLDRLDRRVGLVLHRGETSDLLDEVRSYSWKKKSPGKEVGPAKPQDYNDDCLDALRYASRELPAKADPQAATLIEGTVGWYRAVREKAGRLAQLMGNEHLSRGEISRVLRLGRAF